MWLLDRFTEAIKEGDSMGKLSRHVDCLWLRILLAGFSCVTDSAESHPVLRFDLLESFKQVMVCVGLQLAGQTREGLHGFGIECASVIEFGQIANDPAKRNVQ